LLASASVDTYQAAVARAAELAGGVQALSARLRLPVVDLMRWIQGESKPPKGVFLQVVDYIVEAGRNAVPPRSGGKPRTERNSRRS
jgi:hypothetical protein